jgi:phage terminase large subunit-like protein
VPLFPHGDYDDYVDSTTQAIMRLRGGAFVGHPEDYKDEKIERGNVTYYG